MRSVHSCDGHGFLRGRGCGYGERPGGSDHLEWEDKEGGYVPARDISPCAKLLRAVL